MTPEESIERAVRSACPDCGHWPYTRDAGIFAGWRPAGDRYEQASDRAMRVRVEYDILLCHKRGAAQDEAAAERARFALRRALVREGWTVTDCGPETYADSTETFSWPVTVARSFALDPDGMAYDLRS